MLSGVKRLCPIALLAMGVLFTDGCGSGSSAGTTGGAVLQLVVQISLPASSITLGPYGGATGVALATITTGTQAQWTAATSTSWIHLSNASGTTAALGSVVKFTYDANSGTTRTGSITFQGTAFNQTLTVTQAGAGYVAAVPPLTALNVPNPSNVVDIAGNIYSATAPNATTACSTNTLYEWVAATGNTLSFLFPGTCGNGFIDQNRTYFTLGNNTATEWFFSTSSIYEWPLGTQTETLVPNLPTTSAPAPYCGLAIDWQNNSYGCSYGLDDTTFILFNLANPNATLVSIPSLVPYGFALDLNGNVYVAGSTPLAAGRLMEGQLASGQVTTLAALSATGTIPNASCPAVDGSGNVYFTSLNVGAGNNTLAQWSPATGEVTSVLQLPSNNEGMCSSGDGVGNIYLMNWNASGARVNEKFTSVFVDTTNLSEPANAGSDQLLPVLPATTALNAVSDSSWLTITSQANGIVSFSFTATSESRTAHITLLNQTITVSQELSSPAAVAQIFVPVPPCRVADTRTMGDALGAESTRDFAMTTRNSCGIPSNAAAYALNITAVPEGPLGFLTAWPQGTERPMTSVLNSDGRTKSVASIVTAGVNGGVSLYASDTTHVALDVIGYFVPAGTTPAGLMYYPLAACRALDTREQHGSYLKGGQTRMTALPSGVCQVPATAQAYSLNLTALPHQAGTNLTAWPTGKAMPLVATVTAANRSVTANAAIVPAGVNGGINLSATQDTDLLIDVNGYFAAPQVGGLSLYTMTPCRILDTRSSFLGARVAGFRHINAAANACKVPLSAQALVLNATAMPEETLDYLTLWPDRELQPQVSALNASDAGPTSNLVIVQAKRGAFNAYASQPSHLILDIASYFAP